MTAPTIVTKKSEEPILIVDREGLIGERLAGKIKGDATAVLVSEKTTKYEDIIHIPYDKEFPQIPDNTYSHIFVIDDGSKVTREALPSFLEKAENDNSVFLFATEIREINEKLINDITGYYKKAKILFFGDVFGSPGKAINKEAYVNKFIAQAILKNKILVPEDGTAVSYPIYFEDLIEVLLEAVFGQNENQVFYAFPQYPPTLLTLARMIQKSNPHVTLDFIKEKAKENISIPASGKYMLSDKYPVEEKIKKIEIKEKPFIETDVSKEEPEEENHPRKIPRWGLFGGLILVLLPVISTLFFSFLGGVSEKGLELYLDRGDLEKAQKSAFFSKTYYDLAEKTGSVIPFLDTEFLKKNQNRVGGANLVIEGLKAYDFSEIKEGLTFLQKEKVSFPMLNFATSTVGVWEDLLGFKNKRKYLLLLQDKNEIRPTGGVIDSYSVLTLDKGKLLSFEIKDALEPDSKSRGQVEPPFPIRRYLASSNLRFKDTNFNIDFPQSASTSAVILSVLENERVDGVIALDKSLYLKIEEELEKENASYITLLKLVEEAINKKEIIFAFNDSNLQNVFTANNWSSSLWDTREESDASFNDFLGINEANLSQSKINESVKRTISQDVILNEDGTLGSTVKINYKNDAKESYKNYLRIILPLGSQISEVRINDKAVETRAAIKNPAVFEADNFEEPEELELDEVNQNGKTIYGMFIEIGSGASEEISISYINLKELNLDSHVSYNLKIFKQPYLPSLYKFSISFPSDFETKGVKDFEKELTQDENVLVELLKI